nr:hypothetical protein [Tanacetum cinerariifolium]
DAETYKVDEEKAKEEHVEDQEGNEQARDAQAEVYVSEHQIDMHVATLISSSLSLSSAEYTNQFLNDNPNISVNEVLKELVETKAQLMVDIPIQQGKSAEQRPPLVVQLKVTRLEKTANSMSRFNIQDAIEKSVKAHLKNVLPKEVLDFGKIKLDKATKKITPKYTTTPFDQAALDEFDQKDKLFKLMMESKPYDKHQAHIALYDALVQSLIVDENDMDKQLENPPTQNKRRRDNQDQDPCRC